MIRDAFALSKLYKKKLKEIVKCSAVFFKFKYVGVNKSGKLMLGTNLLQYIFKPMKIDIDIALSIMDTSSVESNSIKDRIDYLYADTVAKRYNLSSVKANNISLRELLRKGAIKEPLYVEYYINKIYGYVRDKHASLVLSIIEVLDSAKNLVVDSTDRVEVIIKNAILREISFLRSPPNRVALGLLSAA